jgi:tetratricopeptide (TPR) repeat protein
LKKREKPSEKPKFDLSRVLGNARKEWARYLKEGGIHRRRALSLFRRCLNLSRKVEDWNVYSQALMSLSSALLSFGSPEKVYQAKALLEEGVSLLSERGLIPQTLSVQIAIFPVLLNLAEIEPLKTATILKEGLATIKNLKEIPELDDSGKLLLRFFEGRFYQEVAHFDRQMRANFRKKAWNCFLESEETSDPELLRNARFRRALILIEEEDFEGAEELLKNCLELAVNSGCERDTGEICQLLSSLCEKKGDFRGANQYLKRTLSCWQKFGGVSPLKRDLAQI